MTAEYSEVNSSVLHNGTLTIRVENKQELEILKTMIGYYPYDTMEKLRKEFGNRFPNVKTEDVRAMVEEISKAINL